MKKILIVGKNSYIGNSFEKWIYEFSNEYSVEKISLKNASLKEYDFSPYDVILHVAGIVHKSISEKNSFLYYEVNRDLAFEVALKAREEGVKQFILLSTMSVYGIKSGLIDEKTTPIPRDHYGRSKLEAENMVLPLKTSEFNIAIIRPPMVYGENCKGNYYKLAKVSYNVCVFPDLYNYRSMIYIDNLTEFIRLIIKDREGGIYCPQNKEFVSTVEMAKVIRKVHGKKTKIVKGLKLIIILLTKKTSLFNKVFGNLAYSKSMSIYKTNYQMKSFYESIELTEIERKYS